ncbi:MAG: NAD(+) synthase [Candidatus Omnitrophota bacterium]
MEFNKDILKIDREKEANRICEFLKLQVREMHKDGIVIGISGGVDSALSAALSVKAFGPDKVLGLILPERESNPVSAEYAKKHADKLGIKTQTIDITPVLESIGSYSKRDEAIKTVFPEYDKTYKSKIVLPADLLAKDAYNFFTLVIIDKDGNEQKARLNKATLNQIVAATNTKHRTRMMQLYYFAEKMNALVCGTTNKTEALEGDFVKYGDGGVDIEPLAHLYKTQVYQIAGHLGVIQEIIDRAPSPDTFSDPVSDQEFYFRIPFDILDLLLYAWENKVSIEKVCQVMQLEEKQVNRAFRDFSGKFNTTKHLREMPAMV